MTCQPIPVLLYHGIPCGRPDDRLAVTFELFQSHLRAIVCAGRTPVTIGELAAGLRAEAPLPARPLAVTFDDGHANNAAALDALACEGLKATLYMTSGFLGRSGMLTSSQLAALAQAGPFEIGAHSVTHPRLDELDPARLDAEITHSRDRIEQLCGRRVSSFAYPYGAYDRAVRQAVADAGFSSAAAVKNALSHTRDDPLAIARWTVGAKTSATEIARVLEGEGLPLAWRRERLRTRGYRVARRARRRLGRVRQPC